MDIALPASVLEILQILEHSGFEAYTVGGCVRDSLLGRQPNDWDICTSALPHEIKQCFTRHKTIDTGIVHGTVTVVMDNTPYEVTTFRTDGVYSDGRHPDCVRFVNRLYDDLSRRDFTINAMAYHPKVGLVDDFGGAEDLVNRKIRCVGQPRVRFEEDALRILRALRFACVLGFDLESETQKAMIAQRMLLKRVASERIAGELNGLLLGDNVCAVLRRNVCIITQMISQIEPMVGFAQHNEHHHLDVWEHTMLSIESAPKNLFVRLALLFHDIGKPLCYSNEDETGHFYGHARVSADIALQALQELRYSKDAINRVHTLVRYHDAQILPQAKYVKRMLGKIGAAAFEELLMVKAADVSALHPDYRGRIKGIRQLQSIYEEIIREKQCFCLKDLQINGHDLMTLGIPQGRQIGEILHALLQMVLDDAVENDKNTLIDTVKKKFMV